MIEDILHARFFMVKASHPFVLVSCGEHSVRCRPVQTLCGTPVANVTLCVNHMSVKKKTLCPGLLYMPHVGRVRCIGHPHRHDLRNANIWAESSVAHQSKSLKWFRIDCETPNTAPNLRWLQGGSEGGFWRPSLFFIAEGGTVHSRRRISAYHNLMPIHVVLWNNPGAGSSRWLLPKVANQR